MEHRIHLDKSMFSSVERPLYEAEGIRIHTFLFTTGVEALRISIGRGEFVWLPFYAQQIWSWKVDGNEQKFNGFISEPSYEAKDFGENYGAFLIHCGLTSMGNPADADDHPQHGELPLARYRHAWIEFSDGEFPVSLCGRYEHRVPFEALYDFSPKLMFHEDGLSVIADNELKNKQRTPLDYIYLNHINFSLEQVRRLEYDYRDFSSETVEILDEVLPGVKAEPERFLTIDRETAYDPELVAIMKNDRDTEHTVLAHKAYHEDGSFYWNAIAADNLDHTVAWLTRTPDRSACGFSLPATAGPRGMTEETRLGNLKTLESEGCIHLRFAFGVSTRDEQLNNVITYLEETHE